MIGRLRGTVVESRPPTVLLDVSGVGYEVDVPLSALEALSVQTGEVVLHTHLSVREDGQALFGFPSVRERDLFRQLIRISGVGPRLALALLSGLDAEELLRCVRNDDVQRLTRVPGVGKKTAQRLLVELRDRLPESALPEPASATAGSPEAPARDGPRDASTEAVEALVSLGYKPAEASRLVDAVAAPERSVEALIRAALQRAVSGSAAR